MRCPSCGGTTGYYQMEKVHRALEFTWNGEPDGGSEDVEDYLGKRRYSGAEWFESMSLQVRLLQAQGAKPGITSIGGKYAGIRDICIRLIYIILLCFYLMGSIQNRKNKWNRRSEENMEEIFGCSIR